MGAGASTASSADRALFNKLRSQYLSETGLPGADEDTEYRLFQDYLASVDAARTDTLSSSAATIPAAAESQGAPAPADVVHGYELGAPVGRGAFAVCRLATRLSDGAQVVVKEMSAPLEALSERERAATETEVAVLRQLSHSNIVQFIESFEAHGVLHIVMEYADGGSLDAHIKAAEGPLPDEEVWATLVQLVDALAYVHAERVLHRDLKPLNVLLSGGAIKLCDFGIARVLQANESFAKSVVGTPYYLSPELCEGKAYDGKSDVWALGCILYELLARRKAFTARGIPGLVMKIMSGEREPLPEAAPRELAALVDRMLAAAPGDRPSTAELLADPLVAAKLAQLRDVRLTPNEPSPAKADAAVAVEPELPRDWYHNARVFQWGGGQARPRLVEDLLEDGVARVACGARHAVALCDNGDVLAWGASEDGQLGLGRPAHDQRRPVKLRAFADNGTKIVGVAAGAAHSLALDSRGDVWVWGAVAPLTADDLQLHRGERKEHWPGWAQSAAATGGGGDSNPFARSSSAKKVADKPQPKPEKPVEVVEGSCFAPHLIASLCAVKVTMIAAGDGFSAALTDDARVLTWGLGDLGRLGLGDEEDRREPTAVAALEGQPALEVACGDAHALARLQGGRVVAWGSNEGGACGNGALDDDTPQLAPAPVAGLDADVARVCCGPGGASAAIRADGDLLLWGAGRAGAPQVRQQLHDDGQRVRDVALGPGGAVYALTDEGVLYAWGADAADLGTEMGIVSPGTAFAGVAAGAGRSYGWVVPRR